ncbi:hypothetical protein C4561_03965 [candidate division WWE3 bacterium]|uniref:4Fe-4S ferredoxin-type domain-containing protein n=1 Tax=candidate division WWE3 bacterium TaxID=2053526 RepID=A0A3A4ZCC2_UNCKA|nr:MAG: hypothetical protein C4561_03965 [candidate division WWE3 bacterium]
MILKVTFPNKCIGCELCVLEAQRQLQKVGFEGSLIRVLRGRGDKGIGFSVELDPRINKLDIKKLQTICPTGVFTISEEDSDEFNQ